MHACRAWWARWCFHPTPTSTIWSMSRPRLRPRVRPTHPRLHPARRLRHLIHPRLSPLHPRHPHLRPLRYAFRVNNKAFQLWVSVCSDSETCRKHGDDLCFQRRYMVHVSHWSHLCMLAKGWQSDGKPSLVIG